MATKQQAPKPPQDPYAQRGKSLTSAVKRLRGWAGSDPSRSAELADALVELTEHRLLGHAYAVAVEDAQDAVRRSVEVLGANGPIGPYTSVEDAVRYLTAVIQVATTQVGLGLPEAAGRTIAALDGLRAQLAELGLDAQLSPLTAIWELSATARAALAAGDPATANTTVDAALIRLSESGVRDDPDREFAALDVDRLAADARWAAGHPDEALGFLHTAKDRWDAVAGDRLRDPGRLSPALVERLAEPLFGTYRDMADRLAALGDLELGLVTRRDLVDRLRGLTSLGDRTRLQLGLSLADLTTDLLAAERLDEADSAATEAAGLVVDWSSAGSARLVVGAVRGRVLTRTGNPAEAAALIRRILPADESAPTAAYGMALLALVEALKADGEVEAAATVEQRFAATGLSAETVTELARSVVTRGRERVTWASASPSNANVEPSTETDAWRETQRAEAHRLEQAREETARVAAEQREAARHLAARQATERDAAEQARVAEAQRAEAVRRAEAEEADRLETKRRREERLEEHRLEVERRAAEEAGVEIVEEAGVEIVEPTPQEIVEIAPTPQDVVEIDAPPRVEPEPAPPLPPVEPAPIEPAPIEPVLEPEPPAPTPDELELAQQEWADARARGDRRAARAANEWVVDLLRPRVEADLAAYGPLLQQALEDLSSARLRSGDIWGSRAPAKEAKALARSLGR